MWHRQEDNASALKDEVIQDLALIFRVFTAEYLGIWLDGSEVSANMNKRDEL